MNGTWRIAAWDLETIADPTVIGLLPPIEKHKSLKDKVKIAEWEEKKRIEQRSKMTIIPNQNIICCAGLYDGNGPGKTFSIPKPTDNNAILLEMEKNLIRDFTHTLSQYDFYITFNGLSFDIPTLNIHSLRHRIKPLNISTRKYYIDNHLDVYAYLSNYERRPGTLDYYAQYFEIGSGKNGMDGSQVERMFYDGKLDEIAEYCLSDCQQTYELGMMILDIMEI